MFGFVVQKTKAVVLPGGNCDKHFLCCFIFYKPKNIATVSVADGQKTFVLYLTGVTRIHTHTQTQRNRNVAGSLTVVLD